MACIIAGAFIPLILCTLNWLPYGFDPPDSIPEAAEFIHLTTPLLLLMEHGHQRAGEHSGSRRKPAAGEGPAWSNCPGTPPPC